MEKFPELKGVWATGKTLEECRRNLEEVIDEWIIARLRIDCVCPDSASFRVIYKYR